MGELVEIRLNDFRVASLNEGSSLRCAKDAPRYVRVAGRKLVHDLERPVCRDADSRQDELGADADGDHLQLDSADGSGVLSGGTDRDLSKGLGRTPRQSSVSARSRPETRDTCCADLRWDSA